MMFSLDLPIKISNSPGSTFQSLETSSQKAKAFSERVNSMFFFSPLNHHIIDEFSIRLISASLALLSNTCCFVILLGT